MAKGAVVATTFDIALAATIVWIALSSLTEAKMFKSTVMFVVFGLFMALAWVRLEAPDVALAEVAIGAGVTGVLMLDAVGNLRGRSAPYPNEAERIRAQAVHTRAGRLWLIPLSITVLMFAVVARALLELPASSVGLSDQVNRAASEIGISNEVTAVLLDFRGYDTLLEIAVLMLATVAVLSLREDGHSMFRPLEPLANPVLKMLAQSIVPLMVLVAGYFVSIGSSAPGGAFQAGAVVGSAGILLILSGYARPRWAGRAVMRGVLALGFLAYLAVALLAIPAGSNFLQYPSELRKDLILLIEVLLTISIGASFVSLFLASATGDEEDSS